MPKTQIICVVTIYSLVHWHFNVGYGEETSVLPAVGAHVVGTACDEHMNPAGCLDYVKRRGAEPSVLSLDVIRRQAR